MLDLNGFYYVAINQDTNTIISSNKKFSSYHDCLANLKVKLSMSYDFKWKDNHVVIDIYHFYNDGDNCSRFEHFDCLVSDMYSIINKEIELSHEVFKFTNLDMEDLCKL